ncbi:MAG: HAMP domain-containing protein [Chromatiales bacterium]|nr:HAMP domain-containing protein [Chromatiales bacterium]
MSILQQFEKSSLPLALKWSLSISVLIVLVMGLLGWFLLTKQEEVFQRQTKTLGLALVDQLAFSASEPLLADDAFALQLLVNRQEHNELVVGMQLFDLKGKSLASAGLSPFDFQSGSGEELLNILQEERTGRGWVLGEIQAEIFVTPVQFKEVTAGYALVSLNKRPLQRDLDALLLTLMQATGGMILLGIILASILARRLSQPIRSLMQASEALSAGQYPTVELASRGDELGKVLNTFNQMASGLEGKEQVEKALSRYVSPNIAKRLIEGQHRAELGGSTVEASVLFCDIVGFTEMAERLNPDQVSEVLNHYFHYISLASSSCEGTVDKFIGDCVMIVFGVPETDKYHSLHAVTCGVLIQAIADRITRQRQSVGLATVEFKVGINSGPVLAGNVGGHERMQFTVVGDTVNVASRLCGLCSPGDVLITEESTHEPGLAEHIRFDTMSDIRVRGRSQPVSHCRVDIDGFSDAEMIKKHLETIFPDQAEA